MFATVARAYIDDWIITDYKLAGDSAQMVFDSLHSCIHIPVAACRYRSCPNCNSTPSPLVLGDTLPAKCKRRRPQARQELLGVVCDVSMAHKGRVTITPKPSRCINILADLCSCQVLQTISQKQAERLVGKLSFIIVSSIFGSIGRAQTLAFYRRSQAKSEDGKSEDLSDCWTPLMSSALAFLELILHPDTLPCRLIEFGDDMPVFLCSDATGDGGIGLNACDPKEPTILWSRTCSCPEWLKAELVVMCPADLHGIHRIQGHLEMLGALVCVLTFTDLIRGRRVTMYQDNAAAFNAAVSGFSRRSSVLAVVGRFHAAVAALSTCIWVEHVDTHAMLADIPSRLGDSAPHKHQVEYDALGFCTRQAVFPSPREWASDKTLFLNVRHMLKPHA